MYVCKSAGFGRSGKKKFFSALRATVSSKYNGGGGGPPAPSLDPQLLTLLFLDLRRLTSLEIENH